MKTEIALPTDYHVVQDAEPENLSGLNKLILRLQVCVTGLHITGGMVVCKNDGGGTIHYHVRKDIARVNQTPVEQADRNDSLFDDFVSAVKSYADKVLL